MTLFLVPFRTRSRWIRPRILLSFGTPVLLPFQITTLPTIIDPNSNFIFWIKVFNLIWLLTLQFYSLSKSPRLPPFQTLTHIELESGIELFVPIWLFHETPVLLPFKSIHLPVLQNRALLLDFECGIRFFYFNLKPLWHSSFPFSQNWHALLHLHILI